MSFVFDNSLGCYVVAELVEYLVCIVLLGRLYKHYFLYCIFLFVSCDAQYQPL